MKNNNRRIAKPSETPRPLYVVWELTLRCDLACRHCGSRAGKPRSDELSVEAALDVVAQLADLGTREITFIGGEAYLYQQWLSVVEAATKAGIRCGLTTGARQLDATMARAAADAGLASVSVSVDGLQSTHDTLRAVPGSWSACMRALGHIADAGMSPLANTQFNQLNLPEVEELAAILHGRGVRSWQVQLTGPMGRAADRPEWLLQPYQLLDLVPRLSAIARKYQSQGFQVHAANNLGYFGPHEQILRMEHWRGCGAGIYTMGIEADGGIKGCPSLPSAPYIGGSVKEKRIAELWETSSEIRFSRDRGTEELWGYCARCYYAPLCRGGCSWTAHTLLGRRGNMPYCHHRALELAAEGRRERLEKVQDAPGSPFDFGQFRIIEEPLPK